MAIISKDSFVSLFRRLRELPAATVDELLRLGEMVHFDSGTTLFRPGDRCQGIGFFLEGEARVFKLAESGREITLYTIAPGETCIMNAACLLSEIDYPAHAETTEKGSALMVPADHFRRLVGTEPVMQKFVYTMFSDRLCLVLELIEEIAFGRLDSRLADYLVERAENGIVRTSHQAIANDLGSSREVVSRLLKDLERRGNLRLSRNLIEIISL